MLSEVRSNGSNESTEFKPTIIRKLYMNFFLHLGFKLCGVWSTSFFIQNSFFLLSWINLFLSFVDFLFKYFCIKKISRKWSIVIVFYSAWGPGSPPPSQRKSRISFRKNKINVTVSWNVKVWCFSIWILLTFYNWYIDYFLQSTISVWSIRVITNNHSKFKVKRRHTTFYLRI
jgi:hypothetical protein